MARTLRDADELLSPAIAETLGNLEMRPEDAAVARLAEGYAREIDASSADSRGLALEKLGPKLLACLESLGATPAARARVLKPGTPAPGANRLAALRAADAR